jgi:inositol-pentakisphosphate 2-kinase
MGIKVNWDVKAVSEENPSEEEFFVTPNTKLDMKKMSTDQHRFSPSCLSALASAQLDLHYLAEGAANVIYGASVQGEHRHCCVVRLRKDLPSTKPAVESLVDFRTRVVPLFAAGGLAESLVEQTVYKLTPEMVDAANRELRESQGTCLSSDPEEASKKIRPHHRRHVYLPAYEREQHGILMQNLQTPDTFLAEFKPKWLLQSPSAPADARNCRTCALNAMRRNKGQPGRGDSGFCPLDLLSDEHDVLRQALSHIWPSPQDLDKFVPAFRQKVQPALKHLRRLQREHGAVGLQDFRHPDGLDFAVAMALRDCSCFLVLRRASREGGDGLELVDVKFADLDLKMTEGGKLEKWAAIERELIDRGWYHRPIQGSPCSLSRRTT